MRTRYTQVETQERGGIRSLLRRDLTNPRLQVAWQPILLLFPVCNKYKESRP